MTAADRPGYHHPDLRSALLEHGIELARAGGPEAVSLRDVQRRAGVSNSAAYRHYADRAALMTAIAAWADGDLGARMRTALAATPDAGTPLDTARARLRTLGRVYVDYAMAEPGLFATIYNGRDKDLAVDHDPAAPFALLGGCLDELVAAGGLTPAHRPWSDVAAWAAVHGVAALVGGGPLHGLGPTEREAVVERMLDILIVGLS